MLSVILIGISLSMDAFAVSVTNGIAMRPFKTGYALWHGLYFGAFQFLMPLAGYILGSTVSGYVTAIGPYVSFALLAFIGGKMILEAVRGGEEGSGGMAALSHKRLLALAVAMAFRFGNIRPAAGKLNIPYLLWLVFAGVLNISVYILNK